MSKTQGFKKPYKGTSSVLKKLFAYAEKERLTDTELGEMMGISNSTIGNWRSCGRSPSRASRDNIKKFLKDFAEEEKKEQMTLVDVQPPKDKRDGQIYTYRTDTPWKKEEPKKEEVPVISDEELIEYALKGMPEDVKMKLLKQMLTERKK